MTNPEKPRSSLDGRIDALHRQLEDERMRGVLAREEALAAARMTHPEIKTKRRVLNLLIVGAAIVALGVVLYFMLRPPPAAERRADDAAWSLPPLEALPDAPELPDLTPKAVKARPRPTGSGPAKTKVRDILGDIGEDPGTDPIGN